MNYKNSKVINLITVMLICIAAILASSSVCTATETTEGVHLSTFEPKKSIRIDSTDIGIEKDNKKIIKMAQYEYAQDIISQYDDAVAYIVVDGLFEYPIFQRFNQPTYFLNHNRHGQQDTSGELFFDFRNDIDKIDKTKNSIVYGHNLKSGQMFGSLKAYLIEDNFNSFREINIVTVSGCYLFYVFSVYEIAADHDYIKVYFGSNTRFKEWLNECKSKSIYKTDIILNENTIILTLSTCTKDDNRLVIQAALVSQNELATIDAGTKSEVHFS